MKDLLMNDVIGRSRQLSDGRVLSDFRHSYMTNDNLIVSYCYNDFDEWDVAVIDEDSNLIEKFSSDVNLLKESKYLCDTITNFYHDGIFLMIGKKTPGVPDPGIIFPPSWHEYLFRQYGGVTNWLKSEYPEVADYPLETYFVTMYYRFLAEQNRPMLDYHTQAQLTNVLGRNKFLYPTYLVCCEKKDPAEALKEVDCEAVEKGEVESNYISNEGYQEYKENFDGLCAFQNYLREVLKKESSEGLDIWINN